MTIPDWTELQRLRYRQGQLLRSQDFRDQATGEALLRAWHNRALHNTFGIVEGLAVELNGASAIVHRGLAYDCFGRELIHQRELGVPLPREPLRLGGAVLIARYKDTRSFPKQGDVVEACLPSTGARFAEQPDFFWKAAGGVSPRDGVPLARLVHELAEALERLPREVRFSGALARKIQYDASRKSLVFSGVMSAEEHDALLKLSPDGPYQAAVGALFQRSQGTSPSLDPDFTHPRARPLARPRIGSGVTAAGGTAWEIWNAQIEQRLIPIGLQVKIDTSAAGFTQVPCYFASLQWPDWNLNDKQFIRTVALLQPLEYVADISTGGFTFRLLSPTLLRFMFQVAFLPLIGILQREFLTFAQQQRLSICWLGIQPEPHQQPFTTKGGVHGPA